jgi:hypothetical protein
MCGGHGTDTAALLCWSPAFNRERRRNGSEAARSSDGLNYENILNVRNFSPLTVFSHGAGVPIIE